MTRNTRLLIYPFKTGGFFLRKDEMVASNAGLLSYKLGAWPIINDAPSMQVIRNINKKNLSRTIATYFQSSTTYNTTSE